MTWVAVFLFTLNGGIASNRKAKRALLDRIPVNRQLPGVCFSGSVFVSKNQLNSLSLFPLSVYSPASCGTQKIRDRRSPILLTTLRYALHVRIDNNNYLIQVCSDHKLFLTNTNLPHKQWHHPPSHSMLLTYIYHVAMGHRLCEIVNNSQSFSSVCGLSLWWHQIENPSSCIPISKRQSPIRTPVVSNLHLSPQTDLSQYRSRMRVTCTKQQTLPRTSSHRLHYQ